MTRIKTIAKNKNTRLWTNKMQMISMTALLVLMINGFGNSAFAQFTFMGDYDKTFAAPKGYYVDPQEPDPTVSTFQTLFYTGEYAPDGSIIAGGMIRTTSDTVDFYMKKFTPSGAVDTSFGTGGVVRTNFHSRFDGVPTYDVPVVLKVQPDGKILFAGQCPTLEPNSQTAAFGVDGCIMRYNANGSLDTTFGGITLIYTYQGTDPVHSTTIEPGKLIFQTGVISNGQSFGTQGRFHDIAIQPDGKIVLVGETRNYANFFAAQGYGAIVVRLNANGSLDSTFGAGGIARWTAPQNGSCFPDRRFFGVRLQADGRIIALGHDGVCNQDGFQGQFFAVTRWTSTGQLETMRRLDSSTDVFQHERAVSAHFTRDGSRLIVSGAYKNLSPSPSSRLNPTMVRLNTGDLSIDTSFGNGGIAQYNVGAENWQSSTLYVKAILPDGRIIGSDNAFHFNTNGVVRFNPNGSSDQSFGNAPFEGNNPALRGRLRVDVTNSGGSSSPMERNPHVLVRPNGRINLLGYTAAFGGSRAVVSQQNTVLENGIYSDFTNDGRTDISVFRDGFWYYLNSTNNQFSGMQFGQSGDKPVPADYDGDGRTDIAVYRNGIWYLQQSTKGFTGIAFGQVGDVPRPGDFDGDGLADICVFRPSDGVWYILRSSDNQFYGTQFGQAGDAPLLADFDADGKSDIAVYRSGIWYYIRSSDNGFRGVAFGASGDIPVVGDYNGDSVTDIAVFRPSNGVWYTSTDPATNYGAVQFGQAGDVPAPGDYDNDGKNDLAVYRSGTWFVRRSGDNSFFSTAFGAANDTPVPAAYQP